jgi:caffeoyl-CoA O-methyltransferase
MRPCGALKMGADSVFGEVDRYIADLFAPTDDALAAVERSIEEAGMPSISVSPTEGKLLYVLALACNAGRILEIGTLAGYSTIWMARALPAGGRVITIEANPDHAEVAKNNLERAGLGERVSVRVGRALDVLPELVAEGQGPFDMIFIDADKPPYADYLRWALQLSRPGTLILADNVVRGGDVLREGATDADTAGIRRFNEALASHAEVSSIVLQSVGARGHDGMALAVVRGCTSS